MVGGNVFAEGIEGKALDQEGGLEIETAAFEVVIVLLVLALANVSPIQECAAVDVVVAVAAT